ncbi:hypothetical protein [Streptomyces sp. NPDC058751]|uniref:hypothetical protein n=1 Tax=Streptomyces sp. NPDC058751 TaxID=3346623 RepID=UPI0036CD5EC6
MDRYPPIADHGPVGDLQTVALVSAKGVMDWFAAPRADSPSIFAALDGDRRLFAGQDTVEAAWRIVDPVLGDTVPVHPYARGTWGAEEADAPPPRRRHLARPGRLRRLVGPAGPPDGARGQPWPGAPSDRAEACGAGPRSTSVSSAAGVTSCASVTGSSRPSARTTKSSSWPGGSGSAAGRTTKSAPSSWRASSALRTRPGPKRTPLPPVYGATMPSPPGAGPTRYTGPSMPSCTTTDASAFRSSSSVSSNATVTPSRRARGSAAVARSSPAASSIPASLIRSRSRGRPAHMSTSRPAAPSDRARSITQGAPPTSRGRERAGRPTPSRTATGLAVSA